MKYNNKIKTMTEFDFHKLQNDSLKVTIKWSAFWVALSFCLTGIFAVFKLGGIWNEQKNRVIRIEKKTDDNAIDNATIRVQQGVMQKSIDKHDYQIDYLNKKVN